MGAHPRQEDYREPMDAQVPSPVGDDDRPGAPAPEHIQASSLDERAFVPDSSHLIARGRNADVYLINDALVLRRLRTGATNYPNVDLVRHLNSYAFPTARVISVDGTDLIMERLHGATLLQALDAEEMTIPQGVRILVDLHTSLHAIPPPPRTGALTPIGSVAQTGRSVLHLDLHPGNILLTATGPQLIDWESARLGPAELDLATTALVFAEVIADGNEYSHAAHSMLRRFTEATGPGYAALVGEAAAIRAAHPTLDPEERGLITEARVVVEQELRQLGGAGT